MAFSPSEIPSSNPWFASGTECARLQICLLGSPLILHGGKPVLISRRQARALLFRLAESQPAIPRDQLCLLLWPDFPDNEARRNLTRILTHLRRALPEPDILIQSGDVIALDQRQVRIDTYQFAYLHRLPSHPSGKILSQPDLQKIETALQLYRSPFMYGFSYPHSAEYEAWITQTRCAYERLYLAGLINLVNNYYQCGDDLHTIQYARQYLETDELAEDVHRRLISSYARLGDRNAVQRQFDSLISILDRELGVSPLPETWVVYQSAIQGIPGKSHSRKSRSDGFSLPDNGIPFVGRDHLLNQLNTILEVVRRGASQAILISGEPGMGKSRLIRAFTAQYAGKATLFNTGCQPATCNLPYHPLANVLRAALQTLSSEASPPGAARLDTAASGILKTTPLWLAEAARLLPEIRALFPNLPHPLSGDHEESRSRLFEALYQLIIWIAGRTNPIILAIDDLHWSDDTTLEWLSYLFSRLAGDPGSPLLLLATYLNEEATRIAGLSQALARQHTLTEFHLTGLDVDEVTALLGFSIGLLPDHKSLATWMHQVSAGNPFFLLETCQVFTETGRLPRSPSDFLDLPLPQSIRELIHMRLARLDPGARQVLEAAAVLGVAAIPFDMLRQTAGRSEFECLEALELLVARKLLDEHEGTYQFRQQQTQQVIYGSLSRARHRLLHQRAAAAYEQLEPSNLPALVRHFELAGQTGKAAIYALQAGQNIKAIFAYQEARNYFDRALNLLLEEAKTLPSMEAIAENQRARIQALEERGWVFRLLGNMEAYEQDLEEEARLVSRLGDKPALAHLCWRRAAARRWFCDYTQARSAAEEGIWLSQEIGNHHLLAHCTRELGLVFRARGDYPQAQAALERALAMFVSLQDTLFQVHTLGNLATLFEWQADYRRAFHLAGQALLLCDLANMELERRLPLGDLGAAALGLGSLDQASKYLTDSLAIARQIADRTQEILSLGHLGYLFLQLGQYALARDHFNQALTLSERIHSLSEQSWLHNGLAVTCLRASDLAQASSHAHRAIDLAECCGRARDMQIARETLNTTHR